MIWTGHKIKVYAKLAGFGLVFLLVVILTLVGLFGVHLLLSSQIDDLNSRIKTTTAELEKYDKINREIDEIKKKLDNLNKKMDVIRQLEANRYEPVRLMETLTQTVIEKKMWLTSVQEGGPDVSISGFAMDDKTIADFMVRLETCGLFSKVTLKAITQEDKDRGIGKGLAGELNRLRNTQELTVTDQERLKYLESLVVPLKNFDILCIRKPLLKAETQGPAQAGAKKK